MIGYRKRLELAQMRLQAQCPVKTHLRKQPEKQRKVNSEGCKLGGKMGRKAAGL